MGLADFELHRKIGHIHNSRKQMVINRFIAMFIGLFHIPNFLECILDLLSAMQYDTRWHDDLSNLFH